MNGARAVSYAVVIPTLGRPSLAVTLAALAESQGPPPERIVLADDRPLSDCGPLDVEVPPSLRDRVSVVASCGHGPAAARNAGWRSVRQEWVAFLDDDTVPGPTWAADLAVDLAGCGPRTGGSQGRIVVPLDPGARPTDWERCTAGLADSSWITADMAYRRSVLEQVGGFDERFRRAFREDADLALRVLDAGWQLTRGGRTTRHPVRPADRWVSVRQQAGNADDVLMNRLHGRSWWGRAEAPRGRLPRHLAITACLVGAAAAGLARRPSPAVALAGLWLAGTGEFALARIAPGPRHAEEVGTMLLTSALIPPAAGYHWARGLLRHRRVQPWPPASAPGAGEPAAAREAAGARELAGAREAAGVDGRPGVGGPPRHGDQPHAGGPPRHGAPAGTPAAEGRADR
ncbi:glycosyltransferase family 2 protein [Streptomyces sp. NRRL S-350]|uniref:glycosyltransferase family 2 protein n=1 Tax=Streptomyces sp. NRRL S-350 TaxID=1463902 RepID=UPI0007C49125|nr:glycosyltransferase [Streptomyces sp. NRRL S-350]